jgi:hypothetical protein
MLDRRWSWAVLAAIGIYLVFACLLIAQKPGLQYDEALLAAGGVHLRHSHAVINLAHDDYSWVCLRDHCFPLMAEGRYIGAIKEYVCWPLFDVFGPRAWLIRIVSVLFGAIGIWGVSMLVAKHVSHVAGVAVALALAIHPAYINMSTFDNGAVGAMMAGLGLLCAAVAFYLDRRTVAAAFWVGAAAGFAVWTRANFVWMLIAGAAAAVLVFGRHILLPLKHWIAIAAGGIVGGFPFLWYNVISNGGTWEAVSIFTDRRPVRDLLYPRLRLLADTILSDGEHREMWGTQALPAWQWWTFLIAVAIGCVVCLATLVGKDRRRWRPAQLAALAFLFLGALLFTSHLQVSEHHLIALVPPAVVAMVLAFAALQARFRSAWILTACFGAVYAGSALDWQFTSMQGLKRTGGIGVWSDGVLDVARHLDQQYPGRLVTILDWGLQQNIYVLTDGRLNSQEIGWNPAANPNGGPPRPWMDLIRDGGVFLLNGPENRNFPAATEQFLRTLDAARPVIHRYTAKQRSGATYAQIIEVEPNSIRGSAPQDDTISSSVSMSDPRAESQLTGFHEIEDGRYRWAKPEFSVLLKTPYAEGGGMSLSMKIFVPEISIRTLGALTLSGRVGGRVLAPMTYTGPGEYSYTRDLPTDGIIAGVNRFEFSVDKHLGPTADDNRELGIVVTEISLEAK